MSGQDNGARTIDEMRARVGAYRRQALAPHEDPVIGCVLVRDVRFFPELELAPPPPDFALNIVQGKSYSVSNPRWSPYFRDLLSRVLDSHGVGVDRHDTLLDGIPEVVFVVDQGHNTRDVGDSVPVGVGMDGVKPPQPLGCAGPRQSRERGP